ncbi:MAG: YcjX family protein [Paracoccaceae bacterium]
MIMADMADRLTRRVERVQSSVSEALFEPVIRLGVTGLSRAGKTVFITSLIANLIDRGRMAQLQSAPRIEAAWLRPQPDDTVARFDYEAHLGAITAPDPHWPQSTRAVSQLRLSLRMRPGGLLGPITGSRIVHLDIIDYPGEWLLDLALLDRSFAQWSDITLARIATRPEAAGFRTALGAADPAAPHDEAVARGLAESYTDYLHAARAAGYSDCTPGRFVLPGELAGSPVLTFAPMPRPDGSPRRGALWREMERRYESYKSRIVKPFFRDHFARIDRQVVLVDALGAIGAGPRALEDLRTTMADILGAFRPGRNAFISQILRGRRVEKILFAATKADHLHHVQHPQLAAIMEALVKEARARADFSGAKTAAMAIASLRATTEEMIRHDGHDLPCVRGRIALPEGGDKQAAFYPGALPDDPAQLLGPARGGAEAWLDAGYDAMRFLPARLNLRPGEGPPHIRLDRAADFLIGDRL